MSKEIKLEEAIQELRSQVQKAIRGGEGHALQFELASINLEFQTVIRRSGGGKLKFSVLGAGAEVDGKYDSDRVHKVALTLQPKLRGDKKDENGEETYESVNLRG